MAVAVCGPPAGEMTGMGSGDVPLDRARGPGADALVAVQVELVAAVAREDAALASLAPDTASVRDSRAVLAFAGRGTATARFERLRRVEAFICRR